jgi:ABC-type glycerol-3-phosphate transport system substrate-binding protein
VFVGALGLALSLAGCGTTKTNLISLDSNKNTIVLECYYGGFGEQWMVNLINKFNASNDKYQITMTKANVNGAAVHLTELESGTCNIDVFFSGESYYQKGFYRDYFEDLSDLLTEKPDGENGSTVQEKIIDADTWLAAGKEERKRLLHASQHDDPHGARLRLRPFLGKWLADLRRRQR